MAGFLNTGLLNMGGVGGLLGSAPASNMTIAQLFNPASMRNQQVKRGLLNAGLALMNPDPKLPPSLGASIGRAGTGFVQGADQAKQDAINNGMLGVQLNQLQREQDAQAAQTAAINQLIPTLPPDIQSFARAYPQQFGEAYLKAKMPSADPYTLGENQVRYGPDGKPVAYGPKSTKAPTVDTIYDEKTGQAYKAQWNPDTGKWDRIGGNKADENGITITNPDGTTTQIGGSGNKTTEGDRRANLLIEQIIAQEPALMAGFDSLASLQNTVGGNTGLAGRAIMTGEAQKAKDSITNVVANWLYLTSGATATPVELERQTAMVTPTALDKPEAIAAKRARLQSIFDTMKIRGNVRTPNGGTSAPPPANDGWTTLPNGVRIRQVQ